jgi:serine/threonine protein kinase
MNNWEKTKQILQEVLNVAPSERYAFLSNSKISTEILSEVESLLAFEKTAEKFMSVTAGGFTKDFFAESEEAKHSIVGQTFGIYEIVEEIGFGGMGAVYLAKRTDGKFEQKVAMKMLKREYNTKKLRRRFEVEKEIQAKLHHPNIAALLDSGTTDDGVPYLVMEYIEGVPIDVFCAEKSLDLKTRLKLFNKVCEAVGYAHRNLIIHRDLKPSNIIVTEKGEPKLLDFGISKLLDAENSEDKNTFTILGAMTPEYASPEQIKGETVTTATDIYSLGVVLFNILTGTHLFDTDPKTTGESLRTTGRHAPRIPSNAAFFREQEIKKLSAQVSSHTLLPFSSARLKGDLDNIILKALRTEPERRYKTVEQFSADIWRSLDGIPIMARPAKISYRASKFYQRNKISVFAGMFIFFALVTGITVAIWQADVARKQANVALDAQRHSEIETERAKTEEAKAKKITAFMSKVISYANPAWYAEGAKFGGNARVIDVLDDLSDKIDTEFAGEADIQAELHHKFTEVYNVVGQREKNPARAENFAQKQKFHALRALELRRQFYGTRHELVAKDMFYAYYYAGDDREQAQMLAQAIQMMRETNPNNLNFPYMLEAYSANLMLPDEYEKHHEPYRNAVFPPSDENKYQIAERYLRESLPVFRLHYKEDNSAIFAAECKLAYTLAVQEKWTDFDEHHAVCKQSENSVSAKDLKWFVELPEKVLFEKNR